jgi:hypothetical protein
MCLGVDLEHAIHLRRHDDHGVVERGGPARETGAAAARDERPVVAAGDRDCRGHLLARPREAHRDGTADCDAGVSRVQRELERLDARTFRTDGGAEVVEKVCREVLVSGVGVRDTRDATD